MDCYLQTVFEICIISLYHKLLFQNQILLCYYFPLYLLFVIDTISFAYKGDPKRLSVIVISFFGTPFQPYLTIFSDAVYLFSIYGVCYQCLESALFIKIDYKNAGVSNSPIGKDGIYEVPMLTVPSARFAISAHVLKLSTLLSGGFFRRTKYIFTPRYLRSSFLIQNKLYAFQQSITHIKTKYILAEKKKMIICLFCGYITN